MPSAVSHAAVGVAASIVLAPHGPEHLLPLAWFCAVAPDLDIVGRFFGVRYTHFFGHRGFFHSPFFCFFLSLFLTLFVPGAFIFSGQWSSYFLFFFCLSLGHGILDSMTDGALGVALLSPFSNRRFHLPWKPIMVCPMNVRAAFSLWGLEVVKNEFFYIWVPCSLITAASAAIRHLV